MVAQSDQVLFDEIVADPVRSGFEARKPSDGISFTGARRRRTMDVLRLDGHSPN
jgi:hypothetical protein